MLRRPIKLIFLLGAGIVLFAGLAFAAKGKTIQLRNDTLLPDGQTLKAGSYAVVVNEKADEVQFMRGSEVVAKHRCKCIEQQKKNETNELVWSEGPQQQPQLQEIRLRGETRVITLPAGT